MTPDSGDRQAFGSIQRRGRATEACETATILPRVARVRICHESGRSWRKNEATEDGAAARRQATRSPARISISSRLSGGERGHDHLGSKAHEGWKAKL